MEEIPYVVKKVFQKKSLRDLEIEKIYKDSVYGVKDKVFVVFAKKEITSEFYMIFIDSKGVIIGFISLLEKDYSAKKEFYLDINEEYIVVWNDEDIIEIVESLLDQGYEYGSREFDEKINEYIVTYGDENLRIYYYDPVENYYERIYRHKEVIDIYEKIKGYKWFIKHLFLL